MSEPAASQELVRAEVDLPRTVGFWGAWAIMVGIMIGGGIFGTPPDIARHLGSPMVAMVFWAGGGVLCLFGALAYAELATMFPRSGGIYVFLREAYGDGVAFIFGWMYLLVTKPAGAAGVAFLFADHLNRLMGTAPDPAHPGSVLMLASGGLDPRLITIAALLGLTWINVRGVVLSTWLAIAFTAAKAAALAAIIVLALVIAGVIDPSKGSAANFRPAPMPISLMAAIPAVMAGVLWTYDGWNDVGAISGEVTNPQRTLPLVFVVGILSVTALYLAINAVYFWLIPLPEQRPLETIGPAVLTHLVGPTGGTIMTALIVISTLGSSHASVLANARVSFAQARDGLLFGSLGAIHPRFNTPHVSLWVGGIMGAAAAWFQGSFVALAGTFVFTMWIFYAMAAGGVIILRVRRPSLARPYRCPGYPVVPAIFVAASLFMTAVSIIQDVSRERADGEPAPGMNTLPWLVVLAAGWPVWLVWKRVARRRDATTGDQSRRSS